MRNLVIGIYDNHQHAEKARKQVLALRNDKLAEMDDAIVVEKTVEGKIKFHHLTHQALVGALFGTMVGAMIGLILIIPVLLLGGMIIGFIFGLISGASTRIGIDPDFVEKQVATMRPGQSALCVQVRGDVERVPALLTEFELDLLQTRIYSQSGELLECKASARDVLGCNNGFVNSRLAAGMHN